MPQGRILLKSIVDSKKVSQLKTDTARLLYTWIIPHLDYNGCFHGDPHLINSKIFGRLKRTDEKVADCLADIQRVGLAILYEAHGDVFYHDPAFVGKQPYLNPGREAKSTIPAPAVEQLKSATPVVTVPPAKGKAQPKIEFANGKWTNITEKDRAILKAAYPACDIDLELAQMAAWIVANPAKGKKKNYHRFITSWLSRSQDKGGTRGSAVAGRIQRPELAYLKEKK